MNKLDIFIDICLHHINCPDINKDISTFIIRKDMYKCSEQELWVLNEYIFPVLFKIYEKNKMPFLIKEEDYTIIKFKKIKDMFDKSRFDFSSHKPDKVLDILCKCQKVYHSFLKFIYICKMKMSKVKNTTDLLLLEITPNDSSSYVYMKDGNKYVFKVSQLKHSIMSCIENTDEYFPEILEVRNPYNNVPFTKCDLYNFYFFLKTNNYGIPDLLHGYFLSGFDNDSYIDKYEILIRDKAIETKAMCGSSEELYPLVFRMLLQYKKYVTSIFISKGFPKTTLVNAMRPYLLLYLNSLYYAQDFPKRYQSETTLIYKLCQFDKISPFFGSRTPIYTNDTFFEPNRKIIQYNACRPNFYKYKKEPVDNNNNNFKLYISEYIQLPEDSDLLFNRIQKMDGSFDAWCQDGEQLDDIDDGSYIESYYVYHEITKKNKHINDNDDSVDSVDSVDSDDSDDIVNTDDSVDSIDTSNMDVVGEHQDEIEIIDVFENNLDEQSISENILTADTNDIEDVVSLLKYLSETEEEEKLNEDNTSTSLNSVQEQQIEEDNFNSDLIDELSSESYVQLENEEDILQTSATDEIVDSINEYNPSNYTTNELMQDIEILNFSEERVEIQLETVLSLEYRLNNLIRERYIEQGFTEDDYDECEEYKDEQDYDY
jgi:hypothetical protein